MRWFIRRLITAAITIFTSITIIFFLIRVMPGNPIDVMVAQLIMQGLDPEEAYRRVLAIVPFVPTDPLWKQYIDYMRGFLSGDLGKSILYAAPVTQILVYGIPWTVFLISISLIVSFSIGIVLGMYIAYKRGGILDRFFSIFSSVTRAIPPYVIGILIVIILGVQLKWFWDPQRGPIIGPYDPRVKPSFTLEFISSLFYHATLPILSYVLTTFGIWVLQMKSSTISVLGEYYIMAAEARGLPEKKIVISYVGRNAILPLFTSLAISIGHIFSGSVFIETIFSYPGIGRYISASISGRDYMVISGCFLIITVAVVSSNLIADLLYSKLDPRIKLR
ncbi:MAG: ABC transporter permease [Candidatus Bathyarchaeia archaeon]